MKINGTRIPTTTLTKLINGLAAATVKPHFSDTVVWFKAFMALVETTMWYVITGMNKIVLITQNFINFPFICFQITKTLDEFIESIKNDPDAKMPKDGTVHQLTSNVSDSLYWTNVWKIFLFYRL